MGTDEEVRQRRARRVLAGLALPAATVSAIGGRANVCSSSRNVEYPDPPAADAIGRSSREYTVWDSRVAGLGVRVRPSGGRSWVLLGHAGGRTKRASLGPVSTTSVADARREALRRQADPLPGNRAGAAKAVPLFRDFVAGPWKEAHFARYKPSGQRTVSWTLERQLLPAFGGKPLDRITPAHVRRWFDRYCRTAPGSANRSLGILSQILNFAVACGHVEANPAAGIPFNRRPALTRFLSREELIPEAVATDS